MKDFYFSDFLKENILLICLILVGSIFKAGEAVQI